MDPRKVSAAKSVVMGWFSQAPWADKEPFLYSLFYTIDVTKGQSVDFNKMIRAFREKNAATSGEEGQMNRSAELIRKSAGNLLVTSTTTNQGRRVKLARKADSIEDEETAENTRKKIKWTEKDENDETKGDEGIGLNSAVYKALDDMVPSNSPQSRAGEYWNKSEVFKGTNQDLKSFNEYRVGNVEGVDKRLQEAPKMVVGKRNEGSQDQVISLGTVTSKNDCRVGIGRVGGKNTKYVAKISMITSSSTGNQKKNPFLIAKK